MSRILAFPPHRGSSRPGSEHISLNNLRFWTIFALIGLDCLDALHVPGGTRSIFVQALSAPLNFAAIAFFLLSGFLFGDPLPSTRRMQYLRHPVRHLALPWLLWFSLSTLAVGLLHPSLPRSAGHSPLLLLLHWARFDLISTSLWLVPCLFTAAACLLPLRRHLHRLRIGLLLAAIHLVSVVNLYTGWINFHPAANLIACVFFLWLGAFAGLHQQRLRTIADLLPTAHLVTLIAIFSILSFGESRLLTALGSAHPTDPLRASNQILSLALCLLFFKLRHRAYPRLLNVPAHTFGLYLSHSLALILLRTLLDSTRSTHALQASLPSALQSSTAVCGTLWLLSFAAVYTACLAACAWIGSHPRLRWTIGAEALPTHRPPARLLDWTLPTDKPSSNVAALR